MRGRNPCWHCRHWGGWMMGHYTVTGQPHAMAGCAQGDRYVPEPQFGCPRWEREPGADDEPHCIDPAGRRWEAGRLR